MHAVNNAAQRNGDRLNAMIEFHAAKWTPVNAQARDPERVHARARKRALDKPTVEGADHSLRRRIQRSTNSISHERFQDRPTGKDDSYDNLFWTCCNV